jgi:hypothetical protein
MSNQFGPKVISRRNFLKIGSLGVLGAVNIAANPLSDASLLYNQAHHHYFKPFTEQTNFLKAEVLNPNQQGRVLNAYMVIYDAPTVNGTPVNKYWRDSVLPLTDITIGTSRDSFNMVWYKIGNEGYVHSSDIQPVLTQLNPIITEVPLGGCVAEVTVPFTDARWNPGEDEPVSYRFYYATTYWVIEAVIDENGINWYGVKDDKWEYTYYVSPSHLRIVPPEEIKTLSSDVPAQHKRNEVHLPEQVMIAFEYNEPVFMARVATGAVFSNGDYSTEPGRYVTFHKRSSRHMARGNLAANGYDLPGVPWNSYITEEGIAFHGTYWHNNFGRPRSHGCINLTPQAAKWLYLWTLPEVPPDQEWIYEDTGTLVEIIG